MLPSKLKHMNLFNDGSSYQGRVEEITLPNLERTMEEYRAAGMSGPVQLDQGLEALSTEWTVGGLMEEPYRQFAHNDYDGVLLLFAGSYDAEDGSGAKAVQIEMRGRHSAIEQGNAKPGEGGTMKMTTQLTYYKLIVNAEVLVEIDVMNMVETTGGVDRLADHRRNLLIN